MRRRERGTGTVELLLAVPFLFLFSVIVFDFMKGFSARMSGELGARHMAWSKGRERWGDHPGPPSAADVKGIHYFRRPDGDVSVNAVNEQTPSVISDILGGVSSDASNANTGGGGDPIGQAFMAGISSLLGSITSFLDGAGGGGAASFLLAKVDMEHGSSVQFMEDVTTFTVWSDPKLFGEIENPARFIGANHYVSLRTGREDDPGKPEGWWDPFQAVIDLLNDAVDAVFGTRPFGDWDA